MLQTNVVPTVANARYTLFSIQGAGVIEGVQVISLSFDNNLFLTVDGVEQRYTTTYLTGTLQGYLDFALGQVFLRNAGTVATNFASQAPRPIFFSKSIKLEGYSDINKYTLTTVIDYSLYK